MCLSDLTPVDALDRGILLGAPVALGICQIVTAAGLRPIAAAGRLVLAIGGAALAVTVFFPQRVGTLTAHGIVAGTAFLAFALWPVVATLAPLAEIPSGGPWATRPRVARASCVVLVLLSFVTPDRRFFRWIGSGALGVAYVLRLVASDVETVEAYTLPFGVLLLAAGLWVMRGDNPPTSMHALAPGVTLSLVPSLPMALADPDSLRALLLGLGSLLSLAVGAWKHWKAPFIAGGLILAMLVIVNLGPYAFVIPRWVLIAGAGALLLGAGVTWEDRVRDGRAVARYVGSLG